MHNVPWGKGLFKNISQLKLGVTKTYQESLNQYGHGPFGNALQSELRMKN
jgi:hypothetical protein